MRVAGGLLLVEILLAGAAPAPPPRAQAVLSAAARAMGRFDPGATIEMRGSLVASGLTGEYRETVRMRDGAYVDDAHYERFSEGEGYDGKTHWKKDRSEATHDLNAPFTRADTVTLAWLRRRGYLQPGSARIEGSKRETIGGQPATVLTMRPRGGNAIRLAFDDSTHLLVWSERTRPLDVITETYSDYRRVGRVKAAFAIDIEESGDHQLIHLSAYRRLAGGASFSAPPKRRDTVMTNAATLPLESADYAVVPATVNGHQYQFVLDTGGHNILLPEAASALGLNTEGQGTSGGSGTGRVTTSDTQVAELILGSARMTDQHFAVLDLGTGFQTKGQPYRAGILGLEIFERMAVTVDEPHGTLTIEPFVAGRQCEGDRVPLLFDDDQPSVRGTIDGIPALIGIDVGNAGLPGVLWRWAQAHGVEARFINGTKGSGSGVGGSNVTYRTSHHDIVIGHTALRDTDAFYTISPSGYFSSRTDSANVGRALLQKHAVRFDYANGYMCIIAPRK